MRVILNKEFEDIEKTILENLRKVNIDATSGTIAKLFADSITFELSDFYKMLQEFHAQSFLSSATDVCLDAIGKLLDCTRNADETDDEFRKRISLKIRESATSNYMSIRLKALTVENVQDLSYKEYSHGSGSFSIAVATDSYFTDNDTIKNVKDAVQEVVAYGTRFTIIAVNNSLLSFKIKLNISSEVSSNDARNLHLEVREKVIDYINSLKIGESLVVNELTKVIMSVSDDIVNYTCEEFKVNGIKQDLLNLTSNWTNRFVISTEPNAINIY